MREILFRGKHIHVLSQNEQLDGAWIYGYLCDKNCINSLGLEGEFLIDPETVCQYTGLTDKNGKRIFEGDIVTISEDGYKEDPDYLGLFPQGQGHFKNYVVEFLDGLYQITYICKRDGDIMHLCKNLVYSRYLEVIGNIFDNPELVN